MMIQILKGTPLWVFALFFALLALGYWQSKPRSVPPARVAIMPAAIGALSLSGVLSVFGPAPAGIFAWGAGVVAVLLANRLLKRPAGVRWSTTESAFRIPGSWLPLAVMMSVFFARYAIAVTLVIDPALARTESFAIGACFIFGLLKGIILARALRIWSERPVQSLKELRHGTR